jgi:plasmid stabilization system protein ParE
MFRILITGPAKRDIQAAHDWWVANRSVEQARRWYQGIYVAIDSLRNTPERCSSATEANLLDQGVKQLLFGLGRRPTHRVVFGIDGDTVIVFRVRHTSQDVLTSDDLV